MPKVDNSNPNNSNAAQKFNEVESNLKAELLRIQTISCSKGIEGIWMLDQGSICGFFQSYQTLPESQIDVAALFEMKGTRLIKSQNKIYLGQMKDQKKCGKGIAIYRDGHIYEGDFLDNEKSGSGVELYGNGNLYIGSFWQNKKHGRGSFYWFNLCAPACTKDAGMNIQQYHGEWWGGLPDGSGQHLKVNGDQYTGGFKNGLKHGSGVEHFGNGSVHKGEYVNGLAEGYGEINMMDGSNYKGSFKQGYRSGYGEWFSKNGKQQYKGEYFLDRKHGEGTFNWGNGSVYKGSYVEDARTGYGELFQRGNRMYQGEWENGKQVGYKVNILPLRKGADLTDVSNQSMMAGTTGLNFRVKTSKNLSNGINGRSMISPTNKNHSQLHIRFIDCKPCTHRNCFACRRASLIESRNKLLKNREKQRNPQQVC